MAVPVEITSQLAPTIFKWVVGLILTGIFGVIMWPFRKMRTEWKSLKDNIESTHKELVQQRTNCLTTLQSQGAEQIALLGKTVVALDGIRLDLAEQTGYLRATAAQPLRRRRAAAAKK